MAIPVASARSSMGNLLSLGFVVIVPFPLQLHLKYR